ncbi:PQQ-binding-like beta-propeller repeat protein, partial [bacterium]|nr:PQQ-binding-like beta-propeller repeat protein [bacterium]
MKICTLPSFILRSRLAFIAILAVTCTTQVARSEPAAAPVHGGLVVQLGASDTTTPALLSKTGRYIFHVLDNAPAKVESAREAIRTQGHYGLASAELIAKGANLPYSEDLVNMVVISELIAPLSEIFRILTPDGVVVALPSSKLSRKEFSSAGFDLIESKDKSVQARKPRPGNMDGWSHPRHAADGNAVSTDTLVGPPQRVRWVAAATSEVEGMVSSGGRNFYGNLLARDSFNGLRLWHNDLRKDLLNDSDFILPRLSSSLARPIASKKHLFASVKNKLVALDAATGETTRTFEGITGPKSLFHVGELIVASDVNSARAFNVESGKELWKFDGKDIGNIV